MAAEKLPWGLKSKSLTPGSMKTISENKLKAFNIGSMNIKKGVTKKEQEDIKKKRQEEEAAEVYKEFVESFEDAQRGLNKSWVKGGVVNPEKGEDPDFPEKHSSKLYKPTSKLLDKKSSSVTPTSRTKDEEKPDRPNKPTPTPQRLWTPTPVEVSQKKKSSSEKRKTNLELFKEELKVIQTERQERRKVKQELGIIEDPSHKARFEPPEPVATGISLGIKPTQGSEDYRSGSYTYENDTQTTNLYLGNINPKMTEVQLCEIFGKYGPLASVKVMWPRSDEEKARGRNCGFVAYMNRKDGERALNALQGKMIMEFEMKLGWGKAVPMPPHPVYIPPALSELTLPPPPSGLPFNSQPAKSRSKPDKAYGNVPPPGAGGIEGMTSDRDPALEEENLDKILANAVVKVVIPTERPLLHTIHRMIEFVVREGPMFEAMIMNRELQNPLFRFLFENQSPSHVYYRWKLFSILQGDSPYQWKTEEFRMFQGGSIWRPPQMNPYAQGMPEELVEGNNVPEPLEEPPKKGGLTESQRDRLEDALRNLTPERTKIGDAMVWCLDHADSAEEVVECIAESMSILQTPIPKKIARLFLISDILHNCSARVPHASFYRKMFEVKLPEIFKDVHDAYEQIDARLKAEQFKQKVMACFRAWEDWAIYASEYLINLQNIFLGLVPVKVQRGLSQSPSHNKDEDIDGTALEDVDGIPIEEIDGMPLDGEPLKDKSDDDLNGIPMKGIVPYGDDIDGEPLDKELEKASGQIEKSKPGPVLSFAPSKWETVDESELEAQAITLSKWDLLEQKRKAEEAVRKADEDIDGLPFDEDASNDEDASQDSSRKGVSDWQSGIDPSASASQSVDEESPEEDSRVATQTRMEYSEAKRAKLREIELRVMRYQDELEAGRRTHKLNMTIAEQVEHYRRKQLRKEEEKEKDKEKEKRREEERERVKEWEQARDKERDRIRKVYDKSDRSLRDDDSEKEDRKKYSDRDEESERKHRDSDRSDRLRDTERLRDSDRSRDRGREHGDRSRKQDRESGTERSRHDGGDGSERGYRDDRERSYGASDVEIIRSRNSSPQSEGSHSETSSYLVGSPLVNYPASPPTSYRASPSDSGSRRKRIHASPKKSSRTESPKRSRKSRSRSRSRHKHKKSRRS